MIGALVTLAVLGLVFGSLLAYAASRFRVERDPRVDEVQDVLPGANCGACGYPGCGGLAEAIVDGRAPVDACPVGGPAMWESIARIMGVELTTDRERMVAKVRCFGGTLCSDAFRYRGIEQCRAAALVQKGPKACPSGCLGFGDCVAACQFGALRINRYGVAEVDPERCTGCGKCVQACPRQLIHMVPAGKKVHVLCANTVRGAKVRKMCKVGCLGCRACVRACEYDAIQVDNNLAVIDYAKCTECGACAQKCPTKVIEDAGRQLHPRAVHEAAGREAAS